MAGKIPCQLKLLLLAFEGWPWYSTNWSSFICWMYSVCYLHECDALVYDVILRISILIIMTVVFVLALCTLQLYINQTGFVSIVTRRLIGLAIIRRLHCYTTWWTVAFRFVFVNQLLTGWDTNIVKYWHIDQPMTAIVTSPAYDMDAKRIIQANSTYLGINKPAGYNLLRVHQLQRR